MSDNSDYSKPHISTFDLLPEVNQSDISKRIHKNIFERFLTKPETTYVDGYIGQGNPNAAIQRQIQEPSPDRQAYQLQPVLHATVGTVDHLTSYKDILNELTRLGVDINRLPVWGNSLQFNWAPPIDTDKLVNYRDYFWFDPTNPTSSPDYITIKNVGSVAEARLNTYQGTLTEFGDTHTIVAMSAGDQSFSVSGNLSTIFTSGYTFVTDSISNLDFSDRSWVTQSSTYNPDDNTTQIFVTQPYTNDLNVTGTISLIGYLSVLEGERDCIVNDSVVWTGGSFTVSQIGSIVWNVPLIVNITHATEVDWLSANLTVNLNDLWFDTTADQLKQYDGTVWVPVHSFFSNIVNLTLQNPLFDPESGCNVVSNDWISQNRWIHKSSVTNSSIAKQAQIPIIEFDQDIEMNEWTTVDHIWRYRSAIVDEFEDSTNTPPLIELKTLVPSTQTPTNIVLSDEDGNQTSTFIPGFQFYISDGFTTELVTVASSTYEKIIPSDFIDRTSIVIDTPTALIVTEVTPFVTGIGDSWTGYDNHWMYVSTTNPIPVGYQPLNVFTNIDDVAAFPITTDPDYDFAVGPYSQKYTITAATTSTLLFDGVLPNRIRYDATTLSSDIRVYIDGNRQYATYTETGLVGGFVTGIVLLSTVSMGQEVFIEVGPAANGDIGNGFTSVRVNPAGTPLDLVDINLNKFTRIEQVKITTNQSPLFDMYDMDGVTINTVSEIFSYAEDQDQPINGAIGRRIISINGGRDYEFNQHLLRESNTTMFGYRTSNNSEPTLHTIWQKGFNDENYIPSYVDGNREEVPVGSADGDWEIPNQLYFNHSHENRKNLRLTQLLTHFNTIIENQTAPSGFVGSPGQLNYLLYENNYGVGGTIKEHNDSYDTFLSTIFNNIITPLSVIEFGQNQYEILLSTIKSIFEQNVRAHLIDTASDMIDNLTVNLSEAVIDIYESNQSTARIYGDSPTYNPITDVGIRNWIATLPFLRLVEKVSPSHSYDNTLNLNEVIHHDGHRSHVEILSTINESIIQQVLTTDDPRVGGSNLGMSSTTPPPTTVALLLSETGSTALNGGVYWYHRQAGQSQLYRLQISQVGTFPPPLPNEGSFWYDTNTDLLMEFISGVWVPSTGSVGDISTAWILFDISSILAETILEVETRLYSAAPDVDELAFDFSSLLSEPMLLNQYNEDAFAVSVNEREISTPFSTQETYDITDPFTWNYKLSSIPTYPSSENVGTESGGTWQDLYQTIYGTPYPHLEPWVLQNYKGKPSWWDDEYLNDDVGTYGNRRWRHVGGVGMWENIRLGIIPLGQIAPDQVTIGTGAPVVDVPTYLYFSVNVDDVSIGGYAPDSLFPPFFNHNIFSGTPLSRTIFDNMGQVTGTGLDYSFGDAGEVEWNWKVSSQYLYDQVAIAFRMQPVRLIHKALGVDFIEVDGLQIDRRTNTVLNHRDTLFHGDVLVDGASSIYNAPGLNQWYVNNTRQSGLDIGSSNFRKLWTDWDAQLTYQFAAFVHVPSLIVSNNNFNVVERDYNILTKRSPGIADFWVDALSATLLVAPRSRVQYNNESEWVFELGTVAPISRRLEYFDVLRHQFSVDPITGRCTIYKYDILSIGINSNTFGISGNQINAFVPGSTFTVTEGSNNGTYTVSSVAYDPSTNQTSVNSIESILNSAADGKITATHRQLSWNTGDSIVLSTTQALPAPLDSSVSYFIIIHNTNEFSLAVSHDDALSGNAIPINSVGFGNHDVGEIIVGFQALGGVTTSNVWRHYVVDTDRTLVLLPFSTIRGVQNVVDIVDGYEAFATDLGFTFNDQGTQRDPITNEVSNWRYETERFIDWAYTTERSNQVVGDVYGVEVDDVLTDDFAFTAGITAWNTGQKVTLESSDQMPSPLLAGFPYFIIRSDLFRNKFKLAFTEHDARNGIAIDLLDVGIGNITVQRSIQRQLLPSFEINPFRNNLWINHEQGVLSHVLDGPYDDIRVEQTIYDQYARQLSNAVVHVLREDKISKIRVTDNIENDIEPTRILTDPHNYIHIGGAHLFLDGYEHLIVFNNYSIDGLLIYDPFIGLNTPRFDVQFDKQSEFTLRPNVGGYVMHNNELTRNIEASILDLQHAYDTYTTSESNTLTGPARDLLGYDGPREYLNQLSINPKSQFAYWRGMIQSKGSVNSMNAFINSRQFIDARADEYWAYKIADFGSAAEKSHPEMILSTRDSIINELRLHFISAGDTPDEGFEGVDSTSDSRWFERPNQQQLLDDMDPMFFDAETTTVAANLDTTPTAFVGSFPWVYQTDVIFDNITATYINSGTGMVEQLVSGIDYNIINSRIIEFVLDPISFPGLTVYTHNPAKSKLNPGKIIDNVAGVVISDAPIWDPARNHHYHNAIHLVDNQSDVDNAAYTNSADVSFNRDSFWNAPEVGDTWLDTSVVGYVPYHDVNIITNPKQRSLVWGKLAEWASVTINQWTVSDVPPEEWDVLAIEEEANNNIPIEDRKTGRAYRVLMKGANRVSLQPLTVYGSIQLLQPLPTTIDVSSLFVDDNEIVDVYKNGIFSESIIVVSSSAVMVEPFNAQDTIEIVRREPTELLLTAGTYTYDYPHSITATIDSAGESSPTYYFWVGHKRIRRPGDSLSLLDAELRLVDPSIPFMIPQKFEAAAGTQPAHYSQLIIRGLSSIVNEDNRYLFRFTRDFTLRDDIDDGDSELELKNLHTEWEIFRAAQPFHIPRQLWDKITESLIQETLVGGLAVPSVSRILYDATHGTDTKYGLRAGQAFVDRNLALNTILQDLRSPDNNFAPIDISNFFVLNEFETAAGIRAAMETIYQTFSFDHVNRIFFSVLQDALTTKLKYPDLFKTSMIAVHGIKLLGVGGEFDD